MMPISSTFLLLALASATLAAPLPSEKSALVQLRDIDDIGDDATLDSAYPLAPLSSAQVDFSQESATLSSVSLTSVTPSILMPTPSKMMVYELDLVASSDPEHPYATELITYMPTSTPIDVPDVTTRPQIQGLAVAVSDSVSTSTEEGGLFHDASLLQEPLPIHTSHLSTSSFSHTPLSTHLLHPTPIAAAAKAASTSSAALSDTTSSSSPDSQTTDAVVILDIITLPVPSRTHTSIHATNKSTTSPASHSTGRASSKAVSHSTRPHRTTTVHAKSSAQADPRPTAAFAISSVNDLAHIDDAQLPPLLSKHL